MILAPHDDHKVKSCFLFLSIVVLYLLKFNRAIGIYYKNHKYINADVINFIKFIINTYDLYSFVNRMGDVKLYPFVYYQI